MGPAWSIRGDHWCGNGVIEVGESCDDNNFESGDGCDACCQPESPPAICGNGNVEFPETCDDGNLVAGDGCDPACALEPAVCGDGIVEYPEACDDANTDPLDGCSADCRVEQCLIERSGDVNGSQTVTSADIITLINYVFKGGPTPRPAKPTGMSTAAEPCPQETSSSL